jgi:hypothetical protein
VILVGVRRSTEKIARLDPGPDGATGTADDGGSVVVWNYPAQYAGSTFVGNERMNIPDDRRPIRNTVEGVFTRRQVGKWDLLGSVAATKVHNCNLPILTSPNDAYFDLEGTWNWQGKISGNYDFPWKLTLSGAYQAYNGFRSLRTAQFSRIPSQGTVTLRMETLEPKGAAKTLINLRIARPINFSQGRRLRLSLELLNVLNGACRGRSAISQELRTGRSAISISRELFEAALSKASDENDSEQRTMLMNRGAAS